MLISFISLKLKIWFQKYSQTKRGEITVMMTHGDWNDFTLSVLKCNEVRKIYRDHQYGLKFYCIILPLDFILHNTNWPSYKRIICTHNNNIPIDIPSHPYVLLDRSNLCNCDIEAESNFLLELLVACGENEKPDLDMHFTIYLAFVDYLVIRNWTNQKQILPISLESFEINSSLLQAPKTLKEFMN